jgi:proteasome lid subunit RPN8/RPN11
MVKAIRPRAWLSDEAAASIRLAAASAHPSEAGGILLGVYTGRRRPWIVRAPVIPSEHAANAYYEIPANARPHVVDRARSRDDRLGYLGEWHSHPADVGPSAQDCETLKRIALDSDTDCLHPVLIVARRSGTGYALDAWQLARIRLRQLRVIASGPLDRQVRRRPPQKVGSTG